MVEFTVISWQDAAERWSAAYDSAVIKADKEKERGDRYQTFFLEAAEEAAQLSLLLVLEKRKSGMLEEQVKRFARYAFRAGVVGGGVEPGEEDD